MRKAHRLKENRSCQFPVRMIFFDTETDKVEVGNKRYEHVFKLGWACFWERRTKRGKDTVEWYEIKEKDDFWEWVFSHLHKQTRLYLVAHNIDFDLGVLAGYEAILKRGFKLHKSWERGMSRFFCWKKKGMTIVAIDNANLFPGKLEGLGESLGLPKLKVDFTSVSMEELSVYCKRDVEIMLLAWKRWIEFCKQEDLGSFAVTLAGQSFNAFRHRFMEHEIFIHNNENALRLERECYKGGRCECFFIGRIEGDKFYYLDVNSMYPFVMKHNSFPVKLVDYKRNISVNYLNI